MVSFYPGPSQLHPSMEYFMKEAISSGILSVNHRSAPFLELSKNTVLQLKEKFGIPKDYQIFFTSSATECWQIIAQSLISSKSTHLYNGAFGEKWCSVTKKFHPKIQSIPFQLNEPIPVFNLNVDSDSELIALTHTETSNGTYIADETLIAIRKSFPNQLIAIDATSSLGGLNVDFRQGDVWFASVQKCLGLPAGMALLICSPNAIKQAHTIQSEQYYNSIIHLAKRMETFETTHTPNVLGIFLLNKVLTSLPTISKIHEDTLKKSKIWYDFIGTLTDFECLIKNKMVQAPTVIAVSGNTSDIQLIKNESSRKGYLLGNGYGDWKTNTFRIANFPSIGMPDIELLKIFLREFTLKS